MLTASIVLFKTSKEQLKTILDCVQNSSCVSRLYLVDNSPTDELSTFSSYASNIEYIFNGANLGYGSAHNIAIKKAVSLGSNYHVVLNPDIRFETDVLIKLISFMDKNIDVGYVLPKVIYPDGSLQYLCKLLPTPSDLIFRRFIPSVGLLKSWKENKNNHYTLKMCGYDKIINPPCLSGCFMFLRLSTLKENDIYFDDNFFMYFEDFDLIRRIHRVSKTLYYPEVTIIHDHAQESYHSKTMLKTHIKSAIKYFNKYGWIFDKERKLMNEKISREIKEKMTIQKTCKGGG